MKVFFWYIKFYNVNYQPDDRYSGGGFRWNFSESPSEFRDEFSHSAAFVHLHISFKFYFPIDTVVEVVIWLLDL
jgi:hypothetical protein